MRVVFMGTPQFAATILEELAQQHDVICAFTQPDKVRGRGKRLVPTPVRETAERLGIPVLTPSTLRDDEVQSYLSELDPDIICVAAYGMLLPKEVLDIPRHGCVNVHASLLPKWRGAAPIERAVLAGDEHAGVCIMRMEEGLDTGDWCVRRQIPIRGISSSEVERELAELGASALLVALEQISQGAASWTSQDDAEATYAKKIEKGELDPFPEDTVQLNERRVLASSAAHPAKTRIGDRDVTIEEAATCEAAVPEGAVSVEGGRLLLGCSDGCLEVLRLKPAGKGSMPASAFLQGFRHGSDGLTWGRP